MPYNPDDLMVQCQECKDWYVYTAFLITCITINFVELALPLFFNEYRYIFAVIVVIIIVSLLNYVCHIGFSFRRYVSSSKGYGSVVWT